MKVKQIITEIERLSKYDYEGGKDTLRHSNVKKKLMPLPGGSGLMYQLDMTYGCVIEIVDPQGQVDRPIQRYHWDPVEVRKYNAAVKTWEQNPVGNKVVGKLNLSKEKQFPMPNSYHVNTITVDEDYRGRGLAKALYGIALSELHMNLISGDSQTPGGRQNWVSLAKIPGCEVVGLLSIYDHRIDDKDVNSLMTIGCDYIGEKNKQHWFYFPIKLSKKEIATKISNNVKVYHDNYQSGGGWHTFLLARWVA